MISEKIILQTDFKEIAAIQLALCVRGKNLSPEVWEKKFLHVPKPNHPYPTSKVKWLAPKKAKGLK